MRYTLSIAVIVLIFANIALVVFGYRYLDRRGRRLRNERRRAYAPSAQAIAEFWKAQLTAPHSVARNGAIDPAVLTKFRLKLIELATDGLERNHGHFLTGGKNWLDGCGPDAQALQLAAEDAGIADLSARLPADLVTRVWNGQAEHACTTGGWHPVPQTQAQTPAQAPTEPASSRPHVLLVGNHPDTPFSAIKHALTAAGADVSWTTDLDLIPKNFGDLRLSPQSLLVNNIDRFDVAMVDCRKSTSYEWSWSPSSVFGRFKIPGRRIGIGPVDRHAYLRENGASTCFTYEQLVNDANGVVASLRALVKPLESGQLCG